MADIPTIEYRYYTRYRIPFTGYYDDQPVDLRVELRKLSALMIDPPPVVELEGAPSPFVMSLDNSDELLATTRTSRAQISFVDDVDLSEFLAEDGFTWQVRLVRTTDSKVLFYGYLTGEAYTQPYIEGPNVVTINAASPAVPVLSTTMPLSDLGTLSIGDILKAIVRKSGVITDIYIPALVTTTQSSYIQDYEKFLDLKFSAWNFIQISDDAAITDELYECDNYASAIDAICKLFGFTMTDIGDGALYFVSPGYAGQYLRLTYDAYGDYTSEAAYPGYRSVAQIKPVDTSDTVEYRQGVGSVKITAAAKNIVVQDTSIDRQVKSWLLKDANTGTTFSPYAQVEPMFAVVAVGKMKVATLNKGLIALPRYKCVWQETADGDFSATWSEAADNDAGNMFQAEWIEQDACDPAEVSSNGITPAQKREWNFNGMYRVEEERVITLKNSQGISKDKWMQIPEDFPLIKITYPIGFVSSGALVIKMQMRCTLQDGFYIPGDYYVAGGSLEGSKMGSILNPYNNTYNPLFWGRKKSIKASLRVGELYRTDYGWGLGWGTFSIPIDSASQEWHPVVTNKTCDMPYAGSDGFYIPIDIPIDGDVEFCLYPGLRLFDEAQAPPVSSQPTRPWGIWWHKIDIKDLSLSYMPALDFVETQQTSRKYYKDFDRAVADDIAIDLRLHSSFNSSAQMSLIYHGDSTPVDKLYIHGEKLKPEQHLLKEYERLYAQSICRHRRGLSLTAFKPIDVWVEGSLDNLQALTGATCDYAEGTGEIYLSTVKRLL